MDPAEFDAAADEESSLTRLFDLHDECRLRALLEAAVFASPEPVSVPQLARALDESAEEVRRLLNQVIADCERPERGVFLRQIGTRYQMATKPEHHEFLQESPPSRAAFPPGSRNPRHHRLQTADFRARNPGHPAGRRGRRADDLA